MCQYTLNRIERGRTTLDFATIRKLVDKLWQLAAEQASMTRAEVSPDSDFVHDLNFDSLDTVEYIMQVEDTFDINVRDAEAEKVKTVRDTVTLIASLLSESQSKN